MQRLTGHFETLMLLLAWFSAMLFVLSGAMLSYEVVARYFFLAPTKWAAELSQLCLIYGSLAAMPWLLQNHRHIRINAVTDHLPAGAKRVLALLTMLVLMVFSSFVVIFGWRIFYDSFERGRTTGSLLDIPSWIAELPVPLFFFFLLIQAVLEILKLARGDAGPGGGHE